MSFFYDASQLGASFKHGESRGEPNEVGLRPKAISHPQRFPKRQRSNCPELKYVQGNAGMSQKVFNIELIFDDEFRGYKSTRHIMQWFQIFQVRSSHHFQLPE